MALAPALSQVLFAPFSPLKIAGCVLWLDASRLSGFADGDPVGTWPDLSGQGNNATQATASKKPTWRATSGPNGRPALLWDGVDDFLKATFPLAQPVTFFIVASQLTTGVNKYIFDGVGGNDKMVFRQNPQSDQKNDLFVNASAPWPNRVVYSTSTFTVWTGLFNGASSVLAKNGVEATGSVNSVAIGGTTIGAAGDGSSVPWNGYIAEMGLYSVDTGAVGRSRLSRYLGQKYGIGVS